MADIELVIKIPKSVYDYIKQLGSIPTIDTQCVANAIFDGTPLPKGHGRLGDLDKVANILEELRDDWNRYGDDYESGMYKGYDYSLDEVMDEPTIIEAESEG